MMVVESYVEVHDILKDPTCLRSYTRFVKASCRTSPPPRRSNSCLNVISDKKVREFFQPSSVTQFVEAFLLLAGKAALLLETKVESFEKRFLSRPIEEPL